MYRPSGKPPLWNMTPSVPS
ncbi:TPA: hypothetical protein J0740_004976, partial [Escherichia coli]|nr:hypothetical protein [Escherichia coli]HAI7022306.1 hypothetical protein [Escherichia coli]HAJ5387119.1 hypothetical protein [Escherichia coli]HAZ3111607.1 hypothetical protein [Escherichia coli]